MKKEVIAQICLWVTLVVANFVFFSVLASRLQMLQSITATIFLFTLVMIGIYVSLMIISRKMPYTNIVIHSSVIILFTFILTLIYVKSKQA